MDEKEALAGEFESVAISGEFANIHLLMVELEKQGIDAFEHALKKGDNGLDSSYYDDIVTIVVYFTRDLAIGVTANYLYNRIDAAIKNASQRGKVKVEYKPKHLKEKSG
jgi:hypothetical protein